jgi:hypothetical protein
VDFLAACEQPGLLQRKARKESLGFKDSLCGYLVSPGRRP